ncbi:MAG: DUF6318 family protein [Aeromicrobium sp.]
MLFRTMTVAILALLAACSSDPAPVEPDPTPTTTTSTPSIPVPTMPAQASEDSPEGAAAFVAHYVDVFNYAAATGDVEELSNLSSPDCKGCQSYIDLYRDTYAAGGYFKGGDWEIGKLKLKLGGTETYATTDVTSGGARFRTNKDAQEKTSATATTKLTFAVRRSARGAQITQLALGDA